MEEINLTDATQNQIEKWVRQFKLPDTLVAHFESSVQNASVLILCTLRPDSMLGKAYMWLQLFGPGMQQGFMAFVH